MADIKISELTYKSPLVGDEEVPIVSLDNPSETKKTKVSDIRGYTDYSGTLTAGSLSVDIRIGYNHQNAKISVFTSVFGVNPTNITLGGAYIGVRFEAQQTDVDVIVRVED